MKIQDKPLGHKAYGSIPHLPSSRIGPGDHHVHEGQARICTEKTRDKHDRIIIQEKLDGSNTAVCLLNNRLLALVRSGYLAHTSRFRQHHMFSAWVHMHEELFRSILKEGERLVGEWLAQAHGTRYHLPHYPWVVFDLMHSGHTRITHDEFRHRISGILPMPTILWESPLSTDKAMSLVDRDSIIRGQYGHHGALDPVEGVVYRVERKDKVDFLAKYVRPDKIDGLYLPEKTGEEPVWNWRPNANL